jgi:hypothetical protein
MTSNWPSISRLTLIPMLAVVALGLQACAVSKPSVSAPIDLPALPDRFIQTSCVPGDLPDRALTQAEVEKLWARDRARLAKCGYSRGGLIAFYTDLRVRLAANGRDR